MTIMVVTRCVLSFHICCLIVVFVDVGDVVAIEMSLLVILSIAGCAFVVLY